MYKILNTEPETKAEFIGLIESLNPGEGKEAFLNFFYPEVKDNHS
jgi:hypothetical protein